MSIHQELIQLFTHSTQEFISGEQLSKKMNCSRTAIWKHIQGLRQQGYHFEAVPHKGYRLLHKPERLQLAELLTRTNTQMMGKTIKLFDEVDSTQKVAHQLVAQGADEGTVIIAESQTAGRGRMGRVWHSPAGKGIWMSIVLKPQIPLQYASQLTLMTAVAVCRTTTKLADVNMMIKWPNDLLINGKKVSGILLESNAEDERLRYVIAGIGMSANLAKADYPEELLDKATSILLESGKPLSREQWIGHFLQEFETLYRMLHEEGFAAIRTLWEAFSYSLHRPIRVQTPHGSVEGTAEEIDMMGALIIKQHNGERVKVYAGDVDA